MGSDKAGMAADGETRYTHSYEGTGGGQTALGTWQELNSWEQRSQAHQRKITILGVWMTMKKINRFISVLLLFQVAASVSAETENCFLWEVKTDTATVYLLGSIHMLKDDLYPLKPCIETAFEKADTLVVEVNILDINQEVILTKMLENSIYTDNQNIFDSISLDTQLLLMDYIENNDFVDESFLLLKPWMVDFTLQMIEFAKYDFATELGIDYHFLERADGDKEIIELETSESQLEIISGFPLEIQDLVLRNTLESLPEIQSILDKLISLWQRGDAEKLHDMVVESSKLYPELEQYFEVFLYQRNQAMTEKIAGFLESENTYMVIIGAGHFGGEKGILSLLEQQGYSVNQLQ